MISVVSSTPRARGTIGQITPANDLIRPKSPPGPRPLTFRPAGPPRVPSGSPAYTRAIFRESGGNSRPATTRCSVNGCTPNRSAASARVHPRACRNRRRSSLPSGSATSRSSNPSPVRRPPAAGRPTPGLPGLDRPSAQPNRPHLPKQIRAGTAIPIHRTAPTSRTSCSPCQWSEESPCRPWWSSPTWGRSATHAPNVQPSRT